MRVASICAMAFDEIEVVLFITLSSSVSNMMKRALATSTSKTVNPRLESTFREEDVN